MPELPDIEAYLHALRPRLLGRTVRGLRVLNPFLLRSVEPPPAAAVGQTVEEIARLGKRIVLSLTGDLHLVLHLMIAGRLRWAQPQAKLHRKRTLAAFDFTHGSLVLTEAGTKRRASLYVVRGEKALAVHDPGGLEVLTSGIESFRRTLRRSNRTLKRALTDPKVFSGIGNAYSDEILHRARLSPFKRSQDLKPEEIKMLFTACCSTLREWTARLTAEAGDRFPERVTAFREEMAVHGKNGQPCPACQAPVQRIIYAERESNYCPGCQTDGKILADRVLSKLLKDDRPRTLDDLERPSY